MLDIVEIDWYYEEFGVLKVFCYDIINVEFIYEFWICRF